MNNDSIFVTVYVASYRNLSYMERCIKNIEKQNYHNFEVVISDDGTPDFDKEKIKSYFSNAFLATHDVRLNYNKNNLGTVANMNKILSLSKGELLCGVSCDDYFHDENVIASVVEKYENTNFDICCGILENENSHLQIPYVEDRWLLEEQNKNEMYQRLCASNFISGATLYYRREFLLSIGGFDQKYRLIEDYPLIFRLVQTGHKIEFLNRITLVHNEDGISTNRIKTLFHNPSVQDGKLVKDEYALPYLKNIKNKKLVRYILACYYLHFSTNKREFIAKFVKYLDIWVLYAAFFAQKKFSKNPTGQIYYMICKDQRKKADSYINK